MRTACEIVYDVFPFRIGVSILKVIDHPLDLLELVENVLLRVPDLKSVCWAAQSEYHRCQEW